MSDNDENFFRFTNPNSEKKNHDSNNDKITITLIIHTVIMISSKNIFKTHLIIYTSVEKEYISLFTNIRENSTIF